MKETEVAAAALEYFSDWELYKEVPAGGIIDIMAVNGSIRLAIECKASFSFDVIEQAEKNKAYAHFSYVCCPKPKGYIPYQETVCKRFGIGVIYLNKPNGWIKNPYCTIAQYARPNKSIYKVRLEDFMKDSLAGTKREGRNTFFSNTVDRIAEYFKREGGKVKIKTVMEDIEHHYSSNKGGIAAISSLCRYSNPNRVIKQFYIKEGYLILDNGEIPEEENGDIKQINLF